MQDAAIGRYPVGRTKLVGDQNGRLLVGHLHNHAAQPPAATCSTPGTAPRRAAMSATSRRSLAARIRGIQGDITRRRIQHRQPAGNVAAELASTLERVCADRLPDDVVDALDRDDPGAVDTRIGHGSADRGETDRIGHRQDREIQLIGGSGGRRGQFGGRSVQADDDSADAVVGQPVNSAVCPRADSGSVCRSSSAAHRRPTRTTVRPDRRSAPRTRPRKTGQPARTSGANVAFPPDRPLDRPSAPPLLGFRAVTAALFTPR